MKSSRFARLQRVVLMLAGMVLTAPLLATGNNGNLVGTPTPMGNGITETVATIMARDAEATAQVEEEDAAPNPSPYAGRERAKNPMSPQVATFPITAPQIHGPVPYTPQSFGVSFTGGTLLDSGFVPPDTMGAAGPKQFIVTVNGLIRSFNKATGVVDGALNTGADNFFASVRSASTSDPRIRFDRLTQRWFVIMIDTGAPNRILIAVSSGPIITAQSSFTFFQFTQDAVPPTGNTGCLMDYPSIGIDVNAIYIGGNQFPNGNAACTAFAGGVAFVVRKSSVLGAGPIVVSAFRGLTGTNPTSCPSVGGDSVTPQGVDNDDPAATNGYFVADSNCSAGIVNIRRVGDPGGTPTLTADMPLTVPLNDVPLKVEHLGNDHPGGTFNGKIDGNDNRPIQSRIVGGSLYTTQGVSCKSDGSSDGVTDDRDCVRFYEVDSLDTTPNLVQAGTIFDSAATNPLFYTYGSMAVSGQGHAAFSFSSIGAASYANGATTGRLASDPLGFTYTPTINVTTATVPYDPTFDLGTSRARRWGDYSAISVDPDDNMTMWGVSEYTDSASNGGSWGVRVNQLLAPPPAAPTGASPSASAQGSTVSTTVTGVSSSGSGFFDPGAGFPKHISASVSGGNVSVVSANYVDPTTVSLQLAINNAAATGARDITITNPDGQSAMGTGIFSVSAGGCSGAALATSPDAVLPSGSIGDSYNEQFSVTGGVGPYTFSSSGNLPAGTGLSASGNLIGTLTADGVYNFSVTASDGVCDVVQSFSVTVITLTVSVKSGDNQSALLNTAFVRPLQAQVVDALGNPVGGVSVTFTAPASGASGTFPGNSTTATATTDSIFGVATSPVFTSNGTLGTYSVVASLSVGSSTASFTLNNVVPLIVTNTNDSGTGSLRQVLSDVPDGGGIQFDPGVVGTITLTSGQLLINKSVSIFGPGARTLAVSGNNSSRVFSLTGPSDIVVNISGLKITGGKATSGGGMQINVGKVALTDLAIVSNTANSGSLGAGIDNEGGAVTILRCTIANNLVAGASASNRGGAIENQNPASSILLLDSTITGNNVGPGKGGGLRNGNSATFTAINSTITNNTATGAGTGGNLSGLAGTITLQNTIVSGGAAASGPDIKADGANFVSNDYNLIQSTSGGPAFAGTTTHNITGVSPNLAALANNGGQTDTRLPNAGSPVIDQGGPGGPSTDQRGLTRPFDNPAVANSGDGSDIGAVEVHDDGISATGSASPDSGLVGTTSTFTVNVTGGFNPASTGISVSANLVDFGGTATQAFTDNGGGVFTFNATVAPSAAIGAHQIAVAVSDAQSRTTGTSIAFEVMSGGELSATTAATPNSVAPSDSTTLTVTVTPGTNPASTGLAVTADLSSIGGSASQAFLDNGVAPDVTAGDGIFTYSATVLLATTPGTKNFLATVSDAQGRTGSANIALTVLTPGALSASGSPVSAAPTATATLTVNVSPGTNPDSTNVAVTADLTAFGGSSTQALSNGGSGNTYTYGLSVPLATTPGVYSVPVTVTDDQSRTANTAVALTVTSPGSLSASGSPVSAAPTATATLTVNVTPGASPTSTGVAVTADLTAFGGSATQALSNGGSGNVYTYGLSVPLATVPGVYSIPVTVTDAQNRTANTTIALTVTAPGALSASGSPVSAAPTATATLTVNVTPGASPSSTGVAVKADLTAFGGSATQALSNGGSGNVYTYGLSVPLAAVPGVYSIPVTVTDAQNRTANTAISLTVLTPTALTATASATPNSGIAGGTSVFQVNVTAGTNPASTGIAVTADLTDFGGTATQAFTDNGGGSFSFNATVQNSAVPGLHVIPVSITDGQGRNASTSIAFNVPAPGALSGAGLSVPGSVPLAGSATLLVAVTPGTSPASSGLTVTANLALIGGDVAQAFHDDGLNGDATAGDNIYTFVSPIGSTIALGTKLLPVAIGDAQARSGTATIQINIVQGTEVIFANGFE